MQRPPAQVLDALASQVQYEGDAEEELYETSEGLEFEPRAFGSVRSAFVNRASGVVREIAQTWGPVSDPLDAGRISAWGEKSEYETVLMAFFRRAGQVAYLAVREVKHDPAQFGIFLGVGVVAEGQPSGGGEGEEGRAWLSLPRLR